MTLLLLGAIAQPKVIIPGRIFGGLVRGCLEACQRPGDFSAAQIGPAQEYLRQGMVWLDLQRFLGRLDGQGEFSGLKIQRGQRHTWLDIRWCLLRGLSQGVAAQLSVALLHVRQAQVVMRRGEAGLSPDDLLENGNGLGGLTPCQGQAPLHGAASNVAIRNLAQLVSILCRLSELVLA